MKFHSLLLGVAGLLLAACDAVAPELRPVAASAQAWLHEQDGQTLVFENDRGQTQSLRVSRRDTVEKDSRKYLAAAPVAHTYLGYRLAAMPDSGFSLKVFQTELVFLQTLRPVGPSGTVRFASLNTFDDEKQENSSPATALARNYMLAGRLRPSMMRLDSIPKRNYFGNLLPSSLPFVGLYYAKREGLVAIKTRDGQLWLRR